MMNLPEIIRIGAGSTRSLQVEQALTANERYPELPSVFATAEMIFAMECAAADAIKEMLPNGFVSVGTLVNVKHLAATPVGEKVVASAKVVKVSEKFITFECEAHDEHTLIGSGEHQRGVVNLKQFLIGINSRANQ